MKIRLFRNGSIPVGISSLGWSGNHTDQNAFTINEIMYGSLIFWTWEFKSHSESWLVFFLGRRWPLVSQVCCDTYVVNVMTPKFQKVVLISMYINVKIYNSPKSPVDFFRWLFSIQLYFSRRLVQWKLIVFCIPLNPGNPKMPKKIRKMTIFDNQTDISPILQASFFSAGSPSNFFNF